MDDNETLVWDRRQLLHLLMLVRKRLPINGSLSAVATLLPIA
jgi:hypothetical protein